MACSNICLDCFTFQPSDCNLESTLCSESPTIKRSFAEETAASKSSFSSAANRSSHDLAPLRLRVVLAGAEVLRVFRVRWTGALDSDSTVGVDVLRVLRTGLSDDVGAGEVLRVRRTGCSD